MQTRKEPFIHKPEVLKAIPADEHKRFEAFNTEDGENFKISLDLIQHYLLSAQPPHSEVVDHMLEQGGREFRKQIGECSTCI